MKLTFRITQQIDKVFDYLTDMQKFAAVHPVISKIEHIAHNNYLVYETLKIGFIPFSFTYPITIESSIANYKVMFRAIVFKLTIIEMKFVLTTENNHTMINEEILFKSPLPIKFIMIRIFKKQHTQLFKNIDLI